MTTRAHFVDVAAAFYKRHHGAKWPCPTDVNALATELHRAFAEGQTAGLDDDDEGPAPWVAFMPAPPTDAEIEAGRIVDQIAGPLADGRDARDARLVEECLKRWPDFAFFVTPANGAKVARVDAWWDSGLRQLRVAVLPDEVEQGKADLARRALINHEIRKVSR